MSGEPRAAERPDGRSAGRERTLSCAFTARIATGGSAGEETAEPSQQALWQQQRS